MGSESSFGKKVKYFRSHLFVVKLANLAVKT